MKIVVAVVFYLLYWFCCFLGTGTDKKNLLGLRSYPDEVQQIVKNEPIEIPKKHVGAFLRGIPLFAAVAAITAGIVTLI